MSDGEEAPVTEVFAAAARSLHPSNAARYDPENCVAALECRAAYLSRRLDIVVNLLAVRATARGAPNQSRS